MCDPSTSASVMITILWYLNFSMSNSTPILVPKAVIMVPISLLSKTFSSRAFSAFIIFPLSGRMAWNSRLRPCFALPPAESPSTIKISLTVASRLEQSANFPGSVEIDSADFLVNSLAFLAATLALAASKDFSIIILAWSGFSNKNLSNCSVKTLLTIPLTSELPSLVFVCPSYWGSGCLTEIIAVNPSRTSSVVNDSSASLTKRLALA